MDFSATSHMGNLEVNMTNIKDAEIRVVVRDIRTLTRGNVTIGVALRDVTQNLIMWYYLVLP